MIENRGENYRGWGGDNRGCKEKTDIWTCQIKASNVCNHISHDSAYHCHPIATIHLLTIVTRQLKLYPGLKYKQFFIVLWRLPANLTQSYQKTSHFSIQNTKKWCNVETTWSVLNMRQKVVTESPFQSN